MSQWDAEAEQAFQDVKQLLTSAPILAYADYSFGPLFALMIAIYDHTAHLVRLHWTCKAPPPVTSLPFVTTGLSLVGEFYRLCLCKTVLRKEVVVLTMSSSPAPGHSL